MSKSGQIPTNQNAADAGMYKSQLHQFCQRRSWPLPEYKTLQEGPFHNPHFRASVVVNGLTFVTSDFFKRAKDAQIEAAKLALAHFASASPPPAGVEGASSINIINGNKRPLTDEVMTSTVEEKAQIFENTPSTKRNKHSGAELLMYKNQLHRVAMKKGYDLPIYACVREGPPHNSRFKSKVTVNGQTFQSPDFFTTLKESEHAAAKVALLSLVPTESQDAILDKTIFKNMLQGLTQKSGLKIPVYNTTSSGASHTPTFVSSVVVDGETFYGQEAKTKKLAEMNAAEVAFACLRQREVQVQGPSGSIPACVSKDVVVSNLQVLDASDLGAPNQLAAPPKVISSQSDTELPKSGDENAPNQISSCVVINSNDSSGSPTTGITTPLPPSQHASAGEPLEYIPLPQDECPSPKTSPEIVHGSVPVSIPDSFFDSSSTLRNVVRVYPRVLNMDLPPGAVAQHSDDKWISARIPANQTGQ